MSPRARRFGRMGSGFVKSYHCRWGVEDVTRGVKQVFRLEDFLVRTWRRICPVAVAFFWLDLWGEERLDRRWNALMAHSWRLPQKVT
ncbi:MAG: hypothetical protein ACUVQG_01960 [Thermogutta sp.]